MNQYETLQAMGEQAYARSAALGGTNAPDAFRVVDIGAGRGAAEYSPVFADLATHYVGVDLDDDILNNPWVDEQVHSSAEDFARSHQRAVADGTAEPFDLATAIYVWEHHREPVKLLRAIHAVLGDDGQAILITPNGLHPFGLASKALAKLDLTDAVLRRLRPDEIDDYHFHVEATRNTIWGVRKCAGEAGFAGVDIDLHDDPGVFQPYLPERWRGLPVAYSKAIAATRLRALSGTLIITLQKGESSSAGWRKPTIQL